MASSYDIFHASVPGAERVMLMHSNLYRPVLRIASKSKLTVSHVVDGNSGFQVILMASNGMPVVVLTQMGDHYFAAPVDTANTLSKTTVADTVNPMYLIKSLYQSAKGAPIFSGALRSAKFANYLMVQGMVRRAHVEATRSRKIIMDYRSYFDDGLLEPLIEVFFGERNAIDLPMEKRQTLEAVRSERDTRRANYKLVMDKLEEMFTPNKWLVTYLPSHGYTVQQVNVSKHWGSVATAFSHSDERPAFDEVTPITFCRTLEDLPSDIRDQVFGTLTLAKMHVQSRYPEAVGMYGAEPHDMLFQGKHHIFSEELGAVIMGEQDRHMMLISV